MRASLSAASYLISSEVLHTLTTNKLLGSFREPLLETVPVMDFMVTNVTSGVCNGWHMNTSALHPYIHNSVNIVNGNGNPFSEYGHILD